MGGMIAQELTLRHPEQVERLVLGCTMPGGPKAKMASEEVSAPLRKGFEMMEKDPERTFEMVMPLLYPPEFIAAHPEMKALMVAAAKMMPPTDPKTPERAMLGIQQFNAYDRLGQIKCPVMIVHGEKDVLVPPENAALIKSKIPHAEVYLIPDAGHAFQAADPVGIHQRIVNWLKN
jgi:3-oxoadipate enol-lactonase